MANSGHSPEFSEPMATGLQETLPSSLVLPQAFTGWKNLKPYFWGLHLPIGLLILVEVPWEFGWSPHSIEDVKIINLISDQNSSKNSNSTPHISSAHYLPYPKLTLDIKLTLNVNSQTTRNTPIWWVLSLAPFYRRGK
jgi:hypothetical protein